LYQRNAQLLQADSELLCEELRLEMLSGVHVHARLLIERELLRLCEH
jgi:hypothetical protein